ncbi:1505_t:CDS:10 [Cetraspora pellucida]|uniref:non-specific serine/threonine protein kinase n=1 Tax=Cetraspora pellucida TaxID=1433469 RepID=A0A9N8VWR8_9GLOM|nr:1505_t:CDS:10 [Cetraspora pellucida]
MRVSEQRYVPKRKVREPYSKQELVGRGAYGSVYKGINNNTNQVVAIKVLNLDTEEDDVGDIIKEINLLSLLNSESQNITRYYGSFLHGTKLWIIMEYAAGGSIRTLLKAGAIEERYISIITREVLLAISYLHKCKIIHRDIKAANILLTAEGKVQLCDFGVAGQLTASNAKRTSFVGTPYWMAPEVITEGAAYDTKADIWSLGITVYEITTGNPPYHDQSAMRAIQLIPKNRPATLEGPYSAPLKEFVAICLNEISEDRPTADELMKTKFIRSSLKHPNGILRDLIARFEQWKQTTGYRQSFSDPYGTPSSESDSYDFEDGQKEEEDAWVFDTIQNTVTHRKSRSLGSLHNSGSDQLSPVIEDEEHMGLTIDNKLKTQENEDVDRTVLPKDNTVRYGRILTDGLLSPSTPLFQRKYSESHHPLLQLFQNEEKTQIDNLSKESSPAGSFRNPTITIPPMNIMSLMPRMEDSPSTSKDNFQSHHMNIRLKDDGLESNSFDEKSKSSLSTSDLSTTDSSFTRIEIVVPTVNSQTTIDSAPKIISSSQPEPNGLLSPTSISVAKHIPKREESGYFSINHGQLNDLPEDKISNSSVYGNNSSGGLLTPPPMGHMISKSTSDVFNHSYSSSPGKMNYIKHNPTRHGSYDNQMDPSVGFPLHKPSSQGKVYPPQPARRVRSATTLNASRQTNEDLAIKSRYQQKDSKGSEIEIANKFGGNLGVGIPRQRATSVGNVLRPSKSKLSLVEDTSSSIHLLPPSPSAAKFLNNSSSSSQGSPTRPVFPSQSSIILNTGPELRPLKMDNYRGTSEVYEDLTKTTDDLLQWMTLLEAGINQLMTRF